MSSCWIMAARSPKEHRKQSATIPQSSAPISGPRPIPMLEVRGVATFYGAIQALHGVDLDVAKGKIVTLIGANGAGKSTLLMTICGTPRAGAGTIRLEGEDISHLPTHEIVRPRVPQLPH